MDMEKMKQWMDLAKEGSDDHFWDHIFEHKIAKELMEENAKVEKQQSLNRVFPLTDIISLRDCVYIYCDLPGVQKKDIHINVIGNQLIIKGAAPSPPQNEVMFLQRERHHGRFDRKLTLPEPTDKKQIKAKFSEGLLVIWYPKLHENEKDPIIIE